MAVGSGGKACISTIMAINNLFVRARALLHVAPFVQPYPFTTYMVTTPLTQHMVRFALPVATASAKAFALVLCSSAVPPKVQVATPAVVV